MAASPWTAAERWRIWRGGGNARPPKCPVCRQNISNCRGRGQGTCEASPSSRRQTRWPQRMNAHCRRLMMASKTHLQQLGRHRQPGLLVRGLARETTPTYSLSYSFSPWVSHLCVSGPTYDCVCLCFRFSLLGLCGSLFGRPT